MTTPSAGNWSNISYGAPAPTPNTTGYTPSPAENSSSVAAPSPDQWSPPPSVAAPSPDQWSPSPSVAAPSPDQWSPSPSVAAPSSDQWSPSQSVAAPSPEHWSPSLAGGGVPKTEVDSGLFDAFAGVIAIFIIMLYCCVIFNPGCKRLSNALGWQMKENYGIIDTAEVELRTADALGSTGSCDSKSEDDEDGEYHDAQYRKDVIEAMT